MGNIYQTHEYKNERIRALTRRIEELEDGQQVKVQVLHQDIANIHFNQTIGWTETNS